MDDYATLAARAADEIKAAAMGVDPGQLAALIDMIAGARRVALHGAGREGLMMKALGMRLHHLGLDAHIVADMTMPPIGEGDLLLVSAGPGDVPTARALAGEARRAGAQVACVTAQPGGRLPRQCQAVLAIPAQTMADDRAPEPASALPMGSLYEGAQYLAFECLVLMLRDRLGVSAQAMRANHANLE